MATVQPNGSKYNTGTWLVVPMHVSDSESVTRYNATFL